MGTLDMASSLSSSRAAALSISSAPTKPWKPQLSTKAACCGFLHNQVSTADRFRGQLRFSNASRFGGSSAAAVLPSAGRSFGVFASGEDIPREILEDSKFVRITNEDPRFGPPALLLLGFKCEEALQFQTVLKEMEGDFLQMLLCTEDMLQGTLGKAINAVQPNLSEVQVAEQLPRITFISGLTGEEIMMLIEIFPQAGLEKTVFAAHVPKNSDKSLKQLMEEIMDDHQRLGRKGRPES